MNLSTLVGGTVLLNDCSAIVNGRLGKSNVPCCNENLTAC